MIALQPLLSGEDQRGKIFRFIVTGGTAAVLEFLVLGLLVEVFHVHKGLAGTVSLIPSVIYVFLMNKYFTFRSRSGKHASELAKFLLVYAAAIGFNIAIYNVLILLHVPYPLAKAVAIGVVAVWNYVLSHGFIFKKGDLVEEIGTF